MKLVMTLLVRDESDIIAANIDFHRAMGVDYFIATDNLSNDDTAAILRQYEREGILHYIHEPTDDYAQHRWVTRMAQMAATRFSADWVINNDADEFWWPERGDLKSTLATMNTAVEAVSATRRNFVPVAMGAGAFFIDAMTICETHSLNALGQPLPEKVCHRAHADIEVAQGNHSAGRGAVSLASIAGEISIMHFPLRSYEQFENKIVKGGAAYARNTYLPEEIGSTWRRLYAIWRSGELRKYYEDSIPSTEALLEGLESGRYYRDERLKRFFDGRRRSGPSQSNDRLQTVS